MRFIAPAPCSKSTQRAAFPMLQLANCHIPAWYAIYTQHQHERNVARILQQKGFPVFLPLYTSIRTWTDRVKKLLMPLFPCYVFVHAHMVRRLDILTTPGVCFLVGGERPSEIPASEIES